MITRQEMSHRCVVTTRQMSHVLHCALCNSQAGSLQETRMMVGAETGGRHVMGWRASAGLWREWLGGCARRETPLCAINRTYGHSISHYKTHSLETTKECCRGSEVIFGFHPLHHLSSTALIDEMYWSENAEEKTCVFVLFPAGTKKSKHLQDKNIFPGDSVYWHIVALRRVNRK